MPILQRLQPVTSNNFSVLIEYILYRLPSWSTISCGKVIVQEATMETEEMHASTDEVLLEKAEQTEEAVLESLLEIRIA